LRRKITANGSQNPPQPLTLTARVSQHLLVKNFPESDDGSFIQMSFISTDLEVKGITERVIGIAPSVTKGPTIVTSQLLSVA